MELELDRYLAVDYLKRDEDPLLWWEKNALFFPNLSKIVKQKFHIPATSVASERIFSKAGNIISERRTRLSTAHVEQLIFLNVNSYLIK